MTRRNRLILGGVGLALGAALVRWQLVRLFTEKASYAVDARFGPLELRRYAGLARAETVIEAPSWRAALELGFRRLFDYIFGDNAPGARIAMTAPVTQAPERAAFSARETQLGPGRYRVTFTMPAERALASLPQPNDARVELHVVPPRRVAALRYSGRWQTKLADKSRELRERVARAGLTPRGEVEFAGYDPPWTLPALRRNEVWIEIAD